jgi:hypothetical protein
MRSSAVPATVLDVSMLVPRGASTLICTRFGSVSGKKACPVGAATKRPAMRMRPPSDPLSSIARLSVSSRWSRVLRRAPTRPMATMAAGAARRVPAVGSGMPPAA